MLLNPLKYRADAQQPVRFPWWVDFCLIFWIPIRYKPDTRRVIKVSSWGDFCLRVGIPLRLKPKPPRERMWTPAFGRVFLTMFLLGGVNYLLIPVMVVYGKRFGTALAAGLAVAIFVMPVILVRPMAAMLCDRFGSKKLLLVVIALMAVSFIGYWKVASYEQLLAIRVLDGIAYGIVSPPLDTISSTVIPRSRWREAHATLGVAGTLAMAVFPTCSLFLVDEHHMSLVFLLGLVITMLAFCLVLFLPDTKLLKTVKIEEQSKTDSIWRTICIISPYGAIWACVAIYLSCTLTYIVPYTRQMGYLGLDWMALLLYTAVVIVVRSLIGRFADRDDRIPFWLSIFAMLCFLTAAIILSMEGRIFFFLAYILNGVAYGCLAPCVYPLGKAMLHPARRSLGSATYKTVYDSGDFIANIAGGWVSAIVGFQYMWLPLMVLGLIPAFGLTWKYMRFPLPKTI